MHNYATRSTIDTVEDVVYLGTSFDEVKASLGPEETLVVIED